MAEETERGPGWDFFGALREAADAYLGEHPTSGKEILMGLMALLADAVLALTKEATPAQCAAMRAWLQRGIEQLPMGAEDEEAE